MTGDLAYVLAGLSAVASVFMLGGLAGFLVLATHEARIDRWARSVDRAVRWMHELEEKGDAAAAAAVRRRLGVVPEAATQEHALGAERGPSDVLPESVAPVVNSGPGSPTVSAS